MRSLQEIQRVVKSFPRNPGGLLADDQFSSSVLAPFVRLDGEYHLLFEKRARLIRQPGEISFPGGGFDPARDGDTRDTAVRETVEELGVPREAVVAFRRIGTVTAGSSAAVDVYPGLIRVDSLESLRPAPSEVEEVFSVPFRIFAATEPDRYLIRTEMHSYRIDAVGNRVVTFPAKELGLPRQYHESWTGRDHEILVYSWKDHRIWGMTARVVRSLVEAYRKEFPA
jgi:peroxisomal coenzyme A diphosphatase NUDT7